MSNWSGTGTPISTGLVVTLSEAQSHLRVDGSDEDALISALIATAQQEIENETGRKLLTQTLELWLDDWPAGDAIELPYPPLASVTSVKYYDTANVEATLANSAYYVDTHSAPGRIVLNYGQDWPATTLRPANGVCVTYVAGWLVVSDVPPQLVAAVKLLVAWLYENRGDGSAQSPDRWPLAITWLCGRWRVRKGFA